MRHHSSKRSVTTEGPFRLLSDEEYAVRFGPEALRVLEGGDREIAVTGKFRKSITSKRRKVRLNKRKRRLMPHDWAFILKEGGKRYPVADAVDSSAKKTGSKSYLRDRIEQTFGQPFSINIAYKLEKAYERQILIDERHVLEKRRAVINRTKEMIERIHERTRKASEPKEEKKEFESVFLGLRGEAYELIYAGGTDTVTIVESADALEKLRPYFDKRTDEVRIYPLKDRYSPFLVYRIASVGRRFVQTNSASMWVLDVNLGEALEQEERYEYVKGSP